MTVLSSYCLDNTVCIYSMAMIKYICVEIEALRCGGLLFLDSIAPAEEKDFLLCLTGEYGTGKIKFQT